MKKKFLLSGMVFALLANSCRSRHSSDVKALTNLNQGEELLDLTNYKILDPKLADRMGAALDKETGYKTSELESTLRALLNAKTEAVNFPREIYYPEFVAIHLYTRSTYSQVNRDLRALPQAPLTAKAGQIVEQDASKTIAKMPSVVQLIASGINKMPRHACTANRGTDLPSKVAKRIEDERYYTEKAFVSTSDGDKGFNGTHKYVINSESCPKSISGISDFPNEKEVLFPPGSEFEVTRMQKKGNERRYCVKHIYPSPPGLKPNPVLSQTKKDTKKGQMNVVQVNSVGSNSDSESSSNSTFENFADPLARPLEEFSWIDLICGKYEADVDDKNCTGLPKFVQFDAINSALVATPFASPTEITDWSILDAKTSAPKVKLKDLVFDIEAVDTLKYKGCTYKEKIIKDDHPPSNDSPATPSTAAPA